MNLFIRVMSKLHTMCKRMLEKKYEKKNSKKVCTKIFFYCYRGMQTRKKSKQLCYTLFFSNISYFVKTSSPEDNFLGDVDALLFAIFELKFRAQVE